MRGMCLGATIIAIGACSTPPKPQGERPPIATGPRDAGMNDAAPAATIDADDEELLPNYAYRFEWQQLRDDYEAFKKTPVNSDSCDFRSRSFRQSVHCLGPHEMAGLMVRSGSGQKTGTAGIVIDRGARDMITTDWTVALLDDGDHPITPWAYIYYLRDDDKSYADVETTPWIAAHHFHVGMRVDKQVIENKLRREGRM